MPPIEADYKLAQRAERDGNLKAAEDNFKRFAERKPGLGNRVLGAFYERNRDRVPRALERAAAAFEEAAKHDPAGDPGLGNRVLAAFRKRHRNPPGAAAGRTHRRIAR